MAKPIFDTTTSKTNNPSLTYVTPESDVAPYSTLGGIAKLANEGLKMAEKYKDSKVDREASNAANELTDEYLTGSETYTNDLEQRKLRLQAELEEDTNNQQVLGQLNDLQGKLDLAVEQDRIGPGEMKHRMMIKSQELTNQYPAYQSEIAARMNQVFSSTGLNNILAADSSLMKTRADAAVKLQTKKIETIETYIGPTAGMSETVIDDTYNSIKSITATKERAEFILDKMKTANETERWRFYDEFTKDGNMQKTSAAVFGTINARLLQIENTPGLTLVQKTRIVRDELARAKSDVIALASNIPQGAKAGELFTTNLLNQLNAMEEKFVNENDGTAALKELSNTAKIYTQQEEIALQRKINIPELNLKLKLIDSLSGLRPGVALGKLEKLINKLSDDAVISTQGLTGDDTLSENYPEVTGGNQLVMQDAMSIHIPALEYLNKEGELSPTHIKMYNNALTLPKSRMTGIKLLEFQDTNLKKYIDNTPDKVLTQLINNSNYSSALKSHLDVYTLTAGQSLYGILGDNKVTLSKNKTDNSLFITQENNPNLSPTQIQATNNALQRVTNIALIENRLAKVSGKAEPYDTTVTDLLNEHFTQIQVK